MLNKFIIKFSRILQPLFNILWSQETSKRIYNIFQKGILKNYSGFQTPFFKSNLTPEELNLHGDLDS